MSALLPAGIPLAAIASQDARRFEHPTAPARAFVRNNGGRMNAVTRNAILVALFSLIIIIAMYFSHAVNPNGKTFTFQADALADHPGAFLLYYSDDNTWDDRRMVSADITSAGDWRRYAFTLPQANIKQLRLVFAGSQPKLLLNSLKLVEQETGKTYGFTSNDLVAPTVVEDRDHTEPTVSASPLQNGSGSDLRLNVGHDLSLRPIEKAFSTIVGLLWGVVVLSIGVGIVASAGTSIKRALDTGGQGEKAGAILVIIGFILLICNMFYNLPVRGLGYSGPGGIMAAVYPWRSFMSSIKDLYGASFYQTDVGETYFPQLVSLTKILRSGQFPLWNPYNFSGFPNFEIGMMGVSYIPRMLTSLLLPPLWNLQFSLAFHSLVACLGMYRFLRSLRTGRAGAFFGGLIWALNGFTVLWFAYDQFMTITALIPWILFFARRAFRDSSYPHAAMAALLLGLLFHTGHLVLVYIWTVIFAGFILMEFKSGLSQAKDWRRPLLIAFIIGAGSLLLASPILIGYVSWQPWLARQPMPYEQFLQADAMNASDVLQSLWNPRPALQPGGRADFPSGIYVGLIPLPFIVFAALTRRAGMVLGVTVIALSSIAALWPPIIWVLYRVFPLFGALHTHFLFSAVMMCFALLAARGTDQIQSLLGSLSRNQLYLWVRPVALSIFVILMMIHSQQLLRYLDITTPHQPMDEAYSFPDTPGIRVARASQAGYHMLPVRAELTDPKVWLSPILTGRQSAAMGLASSSGYESIMPFYMYRLWHAVEQGGVFTGKENSLSREYYPHFFDNKINLSLMRNLSIGLLMATPEARPKDQNGPYPPSELPVLYDGPDMRLYRVNDALPRAFLVPKAAVAPAEAALTGLLAKDFDARTLVLLDQEPKDSLGLELLRSPREGTSKGQATILRDDVNETVIDVTSDDSAFLQVNDSWAPGVVASIDGHDAPVYRSNYAFRAIAVPPGRHVVVVAYRPRLLIVSLALAAITFVVLLGVAVFFAGRRSRAA